jgi:hypothetical protein
VTGIVVRPVRFTDNIEPMRAFLELIGLRPRIESVGGGWIDLVADGGMIALHSAAASDSGGFQGRPGSASRPTIWTPLPMRLPTRPSPTSPSMTRPTAGC